MEISLCMIVKNEEKNLFNCLNSVKEAVEEIIIIDTGSCDGSKNIAEQFSSKIYDFQWCDNFAEARNFSFSKATKDYILWLDADDIVAKEDLEKLLKLKCELGDKVDSVTMVYSLAEDENGKTITSLRRNRLVKREKEFLWMGRVHELLDVSGVVFDSDIVIRHHKEKSGEYTRRNLNIYEKMMEEGIIFSVRDLYYYANELFYHREYEKAIWEFRKFLADGGGWVEDRKNAYLNMYNCYMALGRQKEAVGQLLESLELGEPRAETCCRIGDYFFVKKDYITAILWYKMALEAVPRAGFLGLTANSFYTWVPLLQLCVCYSNLGLYKQACGYNELAGKFLGDSPKILHNRQYFKSVMGGCEG